MTKKVVVYSDTVHQYLICLCGPEWGAAVCSRAAVSWREAHSGPSQTERNTTTHQTGPKGCKRWKPNRLSSELVYVNVVGSFIVGSK